MSEKLIWEALQLAAVAAVTTSTVVPTLPMRIMGATGPKPADGKFVEFINIPNNSKNDYWGDERIYQGNFRIILHWPITGGGVYVPLSYIDEMAAAFPKSRILRNGSASVQIYDVPDLSGMIEANGELLFPLALPYRSFRP